MYIYAGVYYIYLIYIYIYPYTRTQFTHAYVYRYIYIYIHIPMVFFWLEVGSIGPFHGPITALGGFLSCSGVHMRYSVMTPVTL